MLAILLVDDEPMIRLPLGEALVDRGHDVTLAEDGAEALACIDARAFDLVVSDVRLPKADGFAIRNHLRAHAPATDLVLMSAYGTIEEAIAAMRGAAPSYVSKPFDIEELLNLVREIDARRRTARERDDARLELARRMGSSAILGESAAILELRARVDASALASQAILVSGQPGTGKALVARVLHAGSPRSGEPFHRVRCKPASDDHVRRTIELADRPNVGTVYLEDVDALSLAAQATVMETLTRDDVPRFLASTSRSLRALVLEGRFRDDLAGALLQAEIALPPLRERASDIPLLARHFARLAARVGAPAPTFTAAAIANLVQQPFPRNVRDLAIVVERAVVLSRGLPIETTHLPNLEPCGAAR